MSNTIHIVARHQGSDAAMEETHNIIADREKVIQGCIRLLRETNALEVQAIATDWQRTFKPGCFWTQGSGMVIAADGLITKYPDSIQQFLMEVPQFDRFPWGLTLANCDHIKLPDNLWPRNTPHYHYSIGGNQDFMVHRFLTETVRPAIGRHFTNARIFEFHVHVSVPTIPAWIDAEYFETSRALAVYGIRTVDHDELKTQQKGDKL